MNSIAFDLKIPTEKRLPFSKRTLIAVGAALAVALAGVVFIALPRNTVSTDAAYVEADSSVVAPRVRGQIAKMLVGENQSVHRGDPLIQINPEEFDARVASAEADLLDAQSGEAAADAALTSLDAELRLAGSSVRAAQATIASADAQSARAQSDRKRFEHLASEGWVSASAVESHRADAVTAQSEANRARANLSVSRDQAGVVAARRAALNAERARAQAAVARAQAALLLAKQDQTNALIRAPIDGVVGDRQVQAGDYVQPGTRMLTIVPVRALYVVANFKETQTDRMSAGQAVRVRVDALPGKVLTGHVDSFAPGSGSQFSLLPFEPGSGNFTKIVQRVPVRVRLDAGQAGLERLRPGLSTKVTVKLS